MKMVCGLLMESSKFVNESTESKQQTVKRYYIKEAMKERRAGEWSCSILQKEIMKKSKLAMLALCGVLTCGGAAGGAYAIYTGVTETTENQFTIVSGKMNEVGDKVGEITEDKWKPENATGLMPNQEIQKNPKFTSNAEYDAWCIMKVSIPVASMKIGGAETETVCDMVSLLGVDTVNWAVLKEIKSETAGTNTVYYYGYRRPLSKGESTSELFTGIKVPNISELTSNVTDTIDISVNVVQKVGFSTVKEAFSSLKL